MPAPPCGPPLACLLAVGETVRQRLTSRLVDDLSAWWHAPALGLALAAVAAAAVWVLARDTARLPSGPRLLLLLLRAAAVAAVATVLFDLERIDEREVVVPSRVAVLVDSSGSMALTDGAAGDAAAVPRARRAHDVLDAGGLLAALRARHDVAVWRFAADARRLAVLPTGAGPAAAEWRADLEPVGAETRLGEALAAVLAEEPADALAGIVVLSDGASTGGIDPESATRPLAEAGVAVHPLGVGSDAAATNVRIADVAAPARVFPGDAFAVTAYLQPQGLAGRQVRVTLAEPAAPAAAAAVGDVRDAELGADGELVPVRFELPGLDAAGRRTLVVKVAAPAGDRDPADDAQAVEIEVVDRVTRVLLLAGGPSREYQFMRAVLERDRSFAAEAVLGTAPPEAAADVRPAGGAFPATDEALAEFDAVVAFDWDWRTLDEAAQQRLERWVSRESGGLVLVAGGVFMEAWRSDRRPGPVRGLFPVELGRAGWGGPDGGESSAAPRRVRLSREGAEAEFLWLAAGPAASAATWEEFPGFYACFPCGPPKPGATVYARLAADVPGAAADEQPALMAGQFYGSGTVFYLGSGELWRLRGLGAGLHERLVTQLVRHVAQGRLLRGSRHGRLLVDRDRVAVGTPVAVRVVLPPAGRAGGAAAAATATGPDGTSRPVPLAADPGRPDVLAGRFLATREGGWELRVELPGADEPLVRRLHAHLPDLEMARPQLDRRRLAELAAATGGTPRFLADRAWTPDRAAELAAAIPDRSRREYLTSGPDPRFKERLNAALLACAAGLLCLEWAARRLLTLA